MGVATFVTHGNDLSVAAPEPEYVLVGNLAGAWQGKPLDDPTAFPVIAALRHALEAVVARLDALEAVVAEDPKGNKK